MEPNIRHLNICAKTITMIGLLALSLLQNCQKQNDIEEDLSLEYQPSSPLFYTVNLEEAKSNLNGFVEAKRKTNLTKGQYGAASLDDPGLDRPLDIALEPNFEQIAQEDLTNTTEKLTVTPATTLFETVRTRILQVQSLDGEIVSMLFNEIPYESSEFDEVFSGIISITTLDGLFVDAWRVEKGEAISRFSINENAIAAYQSSVKSNNHASSIAPKGAIVPYIDDIYDIDYKPRNLVAIQTYANGHCDEGYNPYSIFCHDVLDEVVVTAPSPYNSNGTSVLTINQTAGCSTWYGNCWRYNNNGYYNYGVNYLNYLKTQPCSEGKVRDNFGQCVQWDPCDYVRHLQANASYIAKVNELKGKTGLRKETGYIQNKDGSFTALATPAGNDHSLNIPTNANMIGFVHTHLNSFSDGVNDLGNTIIKKPIQMFSPNDVISFLGLAKRTLNNGISTSQIYGTMVSSTGIYTLKFTGDPASIPNSFNEESLRDRYKELMEDYFGKEKAFLKFLEEIGVEGVELYKVKDNGTINSKTLDGSGRLKTGDC